MIPYFSITYLNIGPFHLYLWGVFLGLAFLVGYFLLARAGKKLGISQNKILLLVVFIYLGAVIGARLLYVLQWPADFFANPSSIFAIANGGMMYYGGLFGGIIADWLFIRKWSNRWQFVNAIAPIIPLCMAIGRIACFLENDHIGAVTRLPWAIVWPDGVLRQPVALYLILFDLALAGLLWWLGRKANWSGRILFMFLIVYSTGRFLLDFTRDISAGPHILGLAISQWISVVILSTILIYFLVNKPKISLG